MRLNPTWPVLKRYDQAHLRRIALPLGGIGTGTVSLGGRGDLRDWEIVNRPAKGFQPTRTFFAIHAAAAGKPAITKILEGPIDLELYAGSSGCEAYNHHFPRFSRCSFHAAYPLAQILLADAAMPVAVRMEAFNPLVPADADASGIPVAVLRFVVRNITSRRVHAALCGNLNNFIGTDGQAGKSCRNINRFRRTAGLTGIDMRSKGVALRAEQFGTLALATTATGGVSYRTRWLPGQWGEGLLNFWDDFSADGRIDQVADAPGDNPQASLAVAFDLPPHAEKAITFLLAWHFPNRQTWTPEKPKVPAKEPACAGEPDADPRNRVGNYYTTRYADAWEVARSTARHLPELENKTVAFVNAFCESDLPSAVKEAALFNVSTLRSQTCFRTEDGYLFGYEGCGPKCGCCLGSCTHVWNYEQATAFLFGQLACGMRTIEFEHATDKQGFMSFRVALPLRRAREIRTAAADGQMGCLMKLYRDWQLSGDDALLKRLWPKARQALEFCWIKGGWDADRDGVMEGCQHNTMDVEYFGPNPQMGFWYLGALRAVEEMAAYLGEREFAATCRDLFERGRTWLDAHLFNGEYYEHEIRPPRGAPIAPGLQVGMGAKNLAKPKFQLGAGCLVDQLVGQFLAHVCGLGYLADHRHMRRTLQSIMKYNFQENLFTHFNFMRSFALQEEQGLLMATYPRGRRPEVPFPYATEIMTGFEYTAAVHMLYEGLRADGLRCIQAVRARHDGWKRNPFNEPECGNHYSRAMAAWGAVLALTGFQYSGVNQAMQFKAQRGKFFWSNGYAWGTCRLKKSAAGWNVTLNVLHGALKLRTFTLPGAGSVALERPAMLKAGHPLAMKIKPV
ncbi:MAG: GH116 family glycosyl-hydrolase [Kiritimatiellaeota bacterium]|nr:GH116 family glycosyl-hydrolase [Kiritimatiellota bacterium]